MSVLIKGMEMPENCFECPLNTDYVMCGYYEMCDKTAKTLESDYDRRPDDRPLVSVPPHGDLIDRDALKETFCGNCFADEKPMECSEPCMDMRIILEALTIIEAEDGEE